MSLGPLMVDLQGYEISPQEREMLSHPMVGGVILFTRNFQSLPQLRDLLIDIHAIRAPRLLVAVDQEGGRVQRFREGFVHLPAVSRLGQIYKENRKNARECAELTGWLMASELLSIGIDISFAPVLDLDYGISTVIGDRAFHRKPEIVADLAHFYMIGMRKAGMAATGKHFPGHGAVHADSHTDLPVDERRFVDLQADDLVSFERMIHYDIPALMMAHVVYPGVDDKPASFSSVWIKDILRGRMGFEGIIFSDDLTMVAAQSMGSYSERATQALKAGCDMVLICNSPEGRDDVLQNMCDYDNPASHLRLIRMHGHPSMDWEQLHQSEDWQYAVNRVNSYDPEPMLDMDID